MNENEYVEQEVVEEEEVVDYAPLPEPVEMDNDEFPLEAGEVFGPDGVNQHEAIRELQRVFNLDETGEYDEELGQRVRYFQRRNNLRDTGVVDVKTWNVITA